MSRRSSTALYAGAKFHFDTDMMSRSRFCRRCRAEPRFIAPRMPDDFRPLRALHARGPCRGASLRSFAYFSFLYFAPFSASDFAARVGDDGRDAERPAASRATSCLAIPQRQCRRSSFPSVLSPSAPTPPLPNWKFRLPPPPVADAGAPLCLARSRRPPRFTPAGMTQRRLESHDLPSARRLRPMSLRRESSTVHRR